MLKVEIANTVTCLNQTPQPATEFSQCISPISSLVEVEVAEIVSDEPPLGRFSQSKFTSTQVVPLLALRTGGREGEGHVPSTLEQPFKFQTLELTAPLRQDSMHDKFEQQLKTMNACRDLAQKIVRMVADSLNITLTDEIILKKEFGIVQQVANTVEKFVRCDILPQSTMYTGPPSGISAKAPARSPFSLDDYAKILPCDVAIIAEKKRQAGKSKVLAYRCVAPTVAKDKHRCSYKSNFDKTHFERSLGDLNEMSRPRDFLKVAEIVKELMGLVYCSRYHLERAQSCFDEVCETFKQNRMSPSRIDELANFDKWLGQIGQAVQADRAVASKTNCGETPTVQLLYSIDQASSLSVDGFESILHVQPDANLFNFENYLNAEKLEFKNENFVMMASINQKFQPYPKNPKHRTLTDSEISSKIEEMVTTEIKESDIKREGYIYVFRDVEGIGFHKIGYTTSEVGVRLAEWVATCRYDLDQRDDFLVNFERRVLHPRKLEGLIHAELKRTRYQVVNCQCKEKKRHNEWFQVAADYAQKVVAKWTLWMQTKPYNLTGEFVGRIQDIPALGVGCFGADSYGSEERRRSQLMCQQRNSREKSRLLNSDAFNSGASAPSTHRMTTRAKGKAHETIGAF